MSDRNMFMLYAVVTIFVLGALWLYMAPGHEALVRIEPPAE